MRLIDRLVLLILVALVLLAAPGPLSAQKAQSPQQSGPQTPAPMDLLDLLDQRLADMVEVAGKSVVSIRGQMRRTLPVVGPGQSSVLVTGTGFLISDGTVVTTAEVVVNITNPSIVFPDGSSLRATAMSMDVHANIATLKIKVKSGERQLRWGDSARVRAGNLAVTIGNHSGFADSAALGMVANPHQKAMSSKDGKHYESLIQFQGTVGGGGIGSPLLNLHGEVIGMVIGMVTGPGADPDVPSIRILGSSNMGFALPAATIRDALDGLIQNLKPLPEAGWFGLNAKSDPGAAGVTVFKVFPDSPAEHVGIQIGDVILTVDDEPIRSVSNLRSLSDQLSSGQKVKLELRRGDRVFPVLLDITPKRDDEGDTKPHDRPPHVGRADAAPYYLTWTSVIEPGVLRSPLPFHLVTSPMGGGGGGEGGREECG
jgi:serine protease Do